MRWLWLCIGALTVGLLSEARASSYEQVPWRGILHFSTAAGDDTLEVTVDTGAMYRGRRLSFDDTQRAARNSCVNCGPRAWEKWAPGTSSDYFWKRVVLKDQQYRPLDGLTFLIVNMSVTGPLPQSGRPSWRASDKDKMAVRLSDGRVVTSIGPVALPNPRSTVNNPSSVIERHCWQMKAMIDWRILYNQAELRQLWDKSQLYQDRPTTNTFLVGFQNAGQDFGFEDIVDIQVSVIGRQLALERNPAVVQQASVGP